MAAEKDPKNEKKTADEILPVNITDEMKESYLDYAMSVIVQRALPDVRDGLKPVHRRILFAMSEMGLTNSAKLRKSATVVGDVLGKYHPHGDTSVYDAMVKMAQHFTMRYPLVIGQGNFGSVDGDSPAAMRYTEAKMAKIAGEVLRDLEKETVEWVPNYDGTRREPAYLPSAVPGILLNSTLGIAVGMATNIPPHNLGEVVDATIHLIDNEKATNEDLLQYVQGPDFPTGGIAFNKDDIVHASSTGRGGVVTRGEAEIEESKGGNFQIIITSLPYRVNKAVLVEKIADLVRDKKIEGIKGLRDESTADIRVVIDLKAGAQPQKVLNSLYKHTDLESTFNYNMVALVDGVPQTLSLKGILVEFIKHRQDVVTRRTKYDLRKAEERAHILEGLKKALDHIDEVIKVIKASRDTKTAHANLVKKFKLSDVQATAILEMRLQKLAGLERKQVEEELKEKKALIKELKTLLGDPKKILSVIKDELAESKATYGDERKTKIVKGGAKIISPADLIEEKEAILVLTKGGYIKRTDPGEYKKQKRGGVGVIDLNTKDEDFVRIFLTASTHDNLLFFSDKGKVYQIKMYEIPEGRRATKGKSIMNFLPMDDDEYITSVQRMPQGAELNNTSLFMITRSGVAKKTAAKHFQEVRRSGLIAIKLGKYDELLAARLVRTGESIVVATRAGQSIRFAEKDIREMGRAAAGVRAMKLNAKDTVIGAEIVPKDEKAVELLVMSENGYGKQTPLSEYKIQKRGGSGIKTAKITDKTGALMAAKVITEEEKEIVAISKKGQVIRTDIDDVPSLGRQTQGVRIMKLRAGDSIASLVCL